MSPRPLKKKEEELDAKEGSSAPVVEITTNLTPEEKKELTIMQRINKVRKAVRRVERKDTANVYKDGKLAYSYDFASIEDIIDALHDYCVFWGVLILPDTHASNTIKEGKVTRAQVELLVNFVNEDEADDRFTTKFDGEAFDYSDKALGKAYTAAYRTALTRTFMLSTGEIDIERDNIEPEDSTKLTLDQITEIEDRVADIGVTKAQLNQLTNYYNVSAVSDIPLSKYEAILSWLAKIEQAKANKGD